MIYIGICIYLNVFHTSRMPVILYDNRNIKLNSCCTYTAHTTTQIINYIHMNYTLLPLHLNYLQHTNTLLIAFSFNFFSSQSIFSTLYLRSKYYCLVQ